ncbi:MAG: hypothetical protein WEA04_04845 [Candidatus Andersenbacteria bacterium]
MNTLLQARERRLLFNRGLELLIIVVLIIALFYFRELIHSKRVMVYQLQRQLDEAPQYAAQQVSLRTELEKSAHDIVRIESLLVRREALGDFVSLLEKQARQNRVTLRVPDIKEEMVLSAEGKPVAATGPYRDIRLQVTATGEPNDLLQLLHQLEHLPHAVRLPAWSITTTNTAVLLDLRPQAPVIGPDGKEVPVVAPGGLLEATMILTIRQDS